MARLSAAKVKVIKTPGMHGDGNGFYLRVTGSGSRSRMQRIVIHGRRRDLGLGGYPNTAASRLTPRVSRCLTLIPSRHHSERRTVAFGAVMQLAGTDLRVLRVFDAVVRHGGFAAAQAELNVSQPTISNHITALEQRLGVSVCQRGRTGFRLTEKGEMVFAATQRLLKALDDFSEEVGSLKGQLAGDLKVGVVDCIATDPNCRLQEVISRFSARPNEVTLCLSQEFPQNLQEKVLKGDLHIGIGSFPHKIKGLDYTPLYEETHGLYCGRGHHLFDVEDCNLDMETLRNEPIVSRAYWRDEHRKALGFNNVAAVVYQIEPQLISVMSGRYIGFLPEHYARSWVESGALRRLASGAVLYVCGFDMILRSGYRQTRVVETFAGDLRSAYGK